MTIALGTIYFTVLPLYQKEVLEESVAQKVMELSKAEKGLAATRQEHLNAYKQIRRLAANEYANYAGAKCSGLLEPLPPPRPPGRVMQMPSVEDKIFASDPRECLFKATGRASALRLLLSTDRQFFNEAVGRVGENLRAAQSRHALEFGAKVGADKYLEVVRREVRTLRSLHWPDVSELPTDNPQPTPESPDSSFESTEESSES